MPDSPSDRKTHIFRNCRTEIIYILDANVEPERQAALNHAAPSPNPLTTRTAPSPTPFTTLLFRDTLDLFRDIFSPVS